jgi:hydrogenase nickel incorporation protein HypB
MCEKCGCAAPKGSDTSHGGTISVKPSQSLRIPERLDLVQGILDGNRLQAQHNQQHFDAHGIVAINLMSAPGSGKTSLLEVMIPRLRERFRIAVIEGDLETENDARRIRAQGVPAVQITTGTACHLDAALVHDALHQLNLNDIDLLFIENIGNLVCPASFALGQHRNVTLLSVTEGDDKPAKYPVMFRVSDAVLISKTDLLAYLPEFEPARAEQALAEIGSHAPVFRISARDPSSLEGWLDWLEHTVAEVRAGQPHLETGHDHVHIRA